MKRFGKKGSKECCEENQTFQLSIDAHKKRTLKNCAQLWCQISNLNKIATLILFTRISAGKFCQSAMTQNMNDAEQFLQY